MDNDLEMGRSVPKRMPQVIWTLRLLCHVELKLGFTVFLEPTTVPAMQVQHLPMSGSSHVFQLTAIAEQSKRDCFPSAF